MFKSNSLLLSVLLLISTGSQLVAMQPGAAAARFVESHSDDKQECTICARNIDTEDKDITTGSCLHVFHRECLQPWLDRRNTSCPKCRAPEAFPVAPTAAVAIIAQHANQQELDCALIREIQNLDYNEVYALIGQGANVNAVVDPLRLGAIGQTTPLIAAAAIDPDFGSAFIAELLILSGANVNMELHNTMHGDDRHPSRRATALTVARRNKNPEFIQLLINNGAHD